MLIDDILNNKEWKEVGALTSIRSCMEKCHKFILRRDFAMAVDELVHTNWKSNCEKIVPLCRLPYKACWVETAQADRLAYRKNLSVREHEYIVKRVGWLLVEMDNTGAWLAQMFWSFDHNDPKFQKNVVGSGGDKYEFWSRAPFSASITTMRFDPHAKTALEAMEPYGPSFFAINVVKRMKGRPNFDNLDFRGTISDWEGEGSFLMGTLGMLNSKNVVESTPMSFKKKNKGSTRPLYDHHVISIHRRYVKRNIDPSASSDGHKFRQHFCRGHFKVRRTGVFFWHAHRRGDPTLGIVRKDYELTD
jgi:hypothetical protein